MRYSDAKKHTLLTEDVHLNAIESTCVFKTPNYPLDLTRKDAVGVQKQSKLDDRHEKLVNVLDQHHANKIAATGQQLVKKLRNNQS